MGQRGPIKRGKDVSRGMKRDQDGIMEGTDGSRVVQEGSKIVKYVTHYNLIQAKCHKGCY